MKIKIYEFETEERDKRKFCLFPTVALDARLELGKFIVWLEWVEWNKTYNAWISTKEL